MFDLTENFNQIFDSLLVYERVKQIIWTKRFHSTLRSEPGVIITKPAKKKELT